MGDPEQIARFKREAAEEAAAQVEDGMVVGLGTGSTAALVVEALARRIARGLRIVGIATSEQTAAQAQALAVPLASLDEQPELDLTIDGADEIEVPSLDLIKGLGGALLREKLVACASRRLIVVADDSKCVERLGDRVPVPVEVVPFGWRTTVLRLEALGASAILRSGLERTQFVSDGGHYIVDCAFGPIADPAALEERLARTVGVVESGLFVGLAAEAVVVGANGCRRLLRP